MGRPAHRPSRDLVPDDVPPGRRPGVAHLRSVRAPGPSRDAAGRADRLHRLGGPGGLSRAPGDPQLPAGHRSPPRPGGPCRRRPLRTAVDPCLAGGPRPDRRNDHARGVDRGLRLLRQGGRLGGVTHEYTILTGGTVIPGGRAADATAIAWADGTILAIGTDEAVRGMSRGGSRFVDLRGATVIPLDVDGQLRWPSHAVLEVGGAADLAMLADDPRTAAHGFATTPV